MTIRRLAMLFAGTLLAVLVIVVTVALTVYLPYRQELLEEGARLARALEVQEVLLPELLSDSPEADAPRATTLGSEQARQVLRDLEPEFTYYIGRRSGASAAFLQRIGSDKAPIDPRGLASDSALAEAVASAANGEAGRLVGLDEQGRRALFAFKPAPAHDLALVAALPLSAVRGPAIHAVAIASMLWLVTLTVLAMLYYFLSPGRSLLTFRGSGYRAVVDSAPDAILLIDREGRIQSANTAAREMFGFGGAGMLARSIDDLWADPWRVRQNTDIGLFMANGKVGLHPPREVRAVRGDGEEFPATVQVGELSLEGEPLLLLNVHDISEQKAVSRALVDARDAAERAAREQARLLASISHEVRTPVNGVIGMLDLLRDAEPGPQRERYLDLAEAAAASLLTLTNEVLDWARIESGRSAVDSVAFAPADIAEQVLESFRARANAKDLELSVDLDTDLPPSVVGDPGHLRRILSNLVDNAIKFTERGGVRVRVTERSRDEAGCILRFEVSDTGSGIPVAAADRIFEPFRQAGSSSSAVLGGSGLGLSICRSLVRMLGGEIGFDSVPGQGTTFWFTARFSETGHLADEAAQPGAAQSPGVDPTGQSEQEASSRAFGGYRVLIADDMRVNQVLCRDLVLRLGATADLAGNGREAVAAFRDTDYDLVLMDCRMPGLDGFEATREIREWEARTGAERVPIVALADHESDSTRQACLEAGMDDRLAKPCRLQPLRAMLERWLPAAPRA